VSDDPNLLRGARLLRGQVLHFRADPFDEPDTALHHEADGAVLLQNGLIRETGPAAQLLAAHPDAAVEDWRGHVLLAGFVDTHVHYPQLPIIASYGKQLLDWLNTYTFPAELRFADPVHADTVSVAFLDALLRNGTTSASVYCTVHPESVDAFFTASAARGMRMAAGKVLMDRNAPEALTDDAQRAYDESTALIARWHGVGRATYVVTPRFAITSSAEQLDVAGALWRENPGTLMQTHADENHAEIAMVRDLFPGSPDYIGVYETFGLVGPGANFGHCIHLTPREIDVLRDSGSGISHCPTSNLFIGSGLFDLPGLRLGQRIPVGLGTDVGGGSSLSMFATMKAAYEVAQLRGHSLHPAQAFWLATMGGARLLGMEGRIGNIAPGMEADIVVLDLAGHGVLAQRCAEAGSILDQLFALMILGDDRSIRATYIAGEKRHDRDQ
jgi:guanine deaminase